MPKNESEQTDVLGLRKYEDEVRIAKTELSNILTKFKTDARDEQKAALNDEQKTVLNEIETWFKGDSSFPQLSTVINSLERLARDSRDWIAFFRKESELSKSLNLLKSKLMHPNVAAQIEKNREADKGLSLRTIQQKYMELYNKHNRTRQKKKRMSTELRVVNGDNRRLRSHWVDLSIVNPHTSENQTSTAFDNELSFFGKNPIYKHNHLEGKKSSSKRGNTNPEPIDLGTFQKRFRERLTKGRYDLIFELEKRLSNAINSSLSSSNMNELTLNEIKIYYNIYHQLLHNHINSAREILINDDLLNIALDNQVTQETAESIKRQLLKFVENDTEAFNKKQVRVSEACRTKIAKTYQGCKNDVLIYLHTCLQQVKVGLDNKHLLLAKDELSSFMPNYMTDLNELKGKITRVNEELALDIERTKAKEAKMAKEQEANQDILSNVTLAW